MGGSSTSEGTYRKLMKSSKASTVGHEKDQWGGATMKVLQQGKETTVVLWSRRAATSRIVK